MSRDLHVLRKMKLLLKTEWSSSNFANELEKCAKELKTDEVKYQAIELLNSKYITLEAFKAVLSVFLESPQKAGE